MTILPDVKGSSFAIGGVESKLAFVLRCRGVDSPEGSELVVPGGFGKVKGGFAGEGRIRRAICGSQIVLVPSFVLFFEVMGREKSFTSVFLEGIAVR